MGNCKVKQFVNLVLNGEAIEDAAKESGVGEMKMIDVLREVSCSGYAEEMSKVIAGVKEVTQTVKELDNTLMDLEKK
ncbi:hypothetical protein [Clostridium sp. AF32-12BH]|uniref:hypothetical protein n=1 Tax=Clostridium sp. AF32-12BH TaxID=2292006 RepID=UPI000E4BFE3E|nr:hypothetical protein [Clostridium sp. AF32-12BH]RHP46973.1 hypothetical protein DWZ40_08695 [Clostridium sp. AF32-12BH]